MAAIQETVSEKARRNTGDWRGLPTGLKWLAGVFIALTIVAPFLVASLSSDAETTGKLAMAAFAAMPLCALLTYCAAAVIAALRGLLRDQ